MKKNVPWHILAPRRGCFGNHLPLRRVRILAERFLSYRNEVSYTIKKRLPQVRQPLKKAKTLLSTTDFSLSVISRSCGFSSSSYFSQTFKKLSGMSPSAFRRASRQDETTAK